MRHLKTSGIRTGDLNNVLARAEIRQYCWQDYERMESGHRGDWYYMMIGAEARYSTAENPHLQQTITSGFVGGIESDSGEDYFKETESEQLSELKSQLKAIGFSSRAISAAFKSIERTEN